MLAVGDCTDHRTLYEIIWSCLVTMFACAWIALHPGVPQSNHCAMPSVWDNLKRRGMLTLGIVIAPEFMVLWAIEERLLAAKIVKAYNRFCDMESADTSASTSARRSKWTLTHAFFLLMNGFMIHDEQRQPIGPLTPALLFKAIETKEIVHWPPFTFFKEEIEDKSKGDFFTKSVAVVQTSWFVVQCIGRTGLRLPLAGLEVITLAFAIMNVVTYAMWWYKPQNVNLPISVVLTCPEAVARSSPQVASMTNTNIEHRTHEAGLVEGKCFLLELQALYRKARKEGSPQIEPLLTVLFLPFTKVTEARSIRSYVPCRVLGPRLALMLVPTIFGSIHFSSWSAIFPSAVEGFLWQCSSIIYFVIPLTSWHPLNFLYGTQPKVDLGSRQDPRSLREVVMQCSLLLFPVYISARFLLFIIAFSSLRSLPEPAFVDVQWSRYIPHFQ